MRTESSKTLLKTLTSFGAVLILIISVGSCVPSSNGGGKGKRARGATTNNTFSVEPNFGRYLTDNPIILSGNSNLEAGADLGQFLNPGQSFITSNQFLIGDCEASGSTVTNCYEVRESDVSNYITATENRWAFTPSSQDFLQVQTFGNMKDITNKWHDYLEWSYSLAQGYGYESAIPANLFSASNKPFWFTSGLLKGYSNCGVENNAFYDPAGKTICLGEVLTSPRLYIASDPTVTWHEMGHAFNSISINMRHKAFGTNIAAESSLGFLFYDEAGSINEGLADFYSFFVNGRPHFAEWALGRYLVQSRPMTEADSLHAPGVDTTTEGRLSYPTYINYDPNEPENPFEDVHYGGQIPSHFFHAFYTSLQDSEVCGMNSDLALRVTFHLIFETLAEVGDQTATASGSLTTNPNEFKVNLDPTNAVEWMSKNNPINFRRFFQTFSKYFLRSVGNPLFSMCGSNEYPRDDYEKLLDSYGLLLFKTYNEDDNNKFFGHSGTRTTVTPTNRVKSELIKKDLLKLDNRENSATAFVIDNQSDIKNAVESLILNGRIASISSQIDGNFAFNNGNAQISPGEVVGIAPNLFNNSNSTMAGVHILANDWDHTKNGSPCNNLGDNFPLDSEGAADLTSGEGAPGGCDYITRYNGKDPFSEPAESVTPACFVELAEDDATKWVTQDRFRTSLGLSKNNCLGGENSLKDCFIRAVKGADHAYYSKIDPKSTWAESLKGETGVPSFNTSNVMLFEISPWIPPGTTFNCRMRASFTNCEDCYHDENNANDDYLDFEFSGAKPFKIINFKFTVID